jgi:hypothetical protein
MLRLHASLPHLDLLVAPTARQSLCAKTQTERRIEPENFFLPLENRFPIASSFMVGENCETMRQGGGKSRQPQLGTLPPANVARVCPQAQMRKPPGNSGGFLFKGE